MVQKEGVRKAGKKNVLLNVNTEESSVYFILLLFLGQAAAGVGACAESL